MMSAFEWKDGIATLPGSDIRFRLNEFGTLELITEVKTEMTDSTNDSLGTSSFSVTSSYCTGLGSNIDTISASQDTSTVAASCEICRCSLDIGISKNSRFCSPNCAQQQMDRTCKASTGDCKNGIKSSSISSVHNNANDTDRPLKRMRRKRKLLWDSDDEEENLDEEEEKMKINHLKGRRHPKQIKLVSGGLGKKNMWNWASYLEEEKMQAAPLKLFKEFQSFPQSRNGFKVGMRLEGVDPEHPSIFSILSVAEVQGYRMRLHFDGYPECYDFWVNADSPDIHPVGWCEKTGHKLHPPKGYKESEFNWTTYLKTCKAQAAPKHLFKSLNTPVTPSGFRVGMKLEAVDKKNPSLTCVATIADMVDNRLLIHFDSWDDSFDYWCDASSPYIRSVGYCQESGIPLTTPPDYKDHTTFSWDKYLEETNSLAAPARAFKLRPAHGFQLNTKLEAVDKRNPMLIRVSTIVDKDDHRIKLHFDGWHPNYDYWVDADSPDIHPGGWCAKTGHPLQLPPSPPDFVIPPGQGCPTPGCQGLGHIRGPRYGTHYTLVGCPYSEANMNREASLPDRLNGERPPPAVNIQKAKRAETPTAAIDLQEDSPHSKKSSSHDGEQSGRSSVHSFTECSENGQDKDFTEDDRCIDNRVKNKRQNCNQGVWKLQLVKEEQPDEKDPEFTLQQILHQSVFMSSLSSNPVNRLHLCWEQHCKLLPEVSGLSAKSVAKWTIEEVAGFIQRLPGCKEQASIFRSEQIDGEAFLLLTQTDIVKILNIKLGPALKIYNAILMFRTAED